MKDILVNLLIVEINLVRMKVVAIELTHIFKGWVLVPVVSLEDMTNGRLNHAKRGEAKDIKLDEAHRLKVANVLPLTPRRLHDTTTGNQWHMLVQILTDNNTPCVTGRGAHLSVESLNVVLDVGILLKVIFQRD